MIDGKDINGYAKKITTNHLFQAALVVLGAAFTISTIANNYYSIQWNKMRIKMEKSKISKDENQ